MGSLGGPFGQFGAHLEDQMQDFCHFRVNFTHFCSQNGPDPHFRPLNGPYYNCMFIFWLKKIAEIGPIITQILI